MNCEYWPHAPVTRGRPPHPVRKARGRTILLIGDSLLGQTAPHLCDALGLSGMPATVIDESYPGTGLPDDSAVAVQNQKVDACPAASIVVAFSGNCFVCLVERGSP